MSSSSSVEYSSSESSGEANWLPGWGKRIRFETDSSKVDASLSNFPPLISGYLLSGLSRFFFQWLFQFKSRKFRFNFEVL